MPNIIFEGKKLILPKKRPNSEKKTLAQSLRRQWELHPRQNHGKEIQESAISSRLFIQAEKPR